MSDNNKTELKDDELINVSGGSDGNNEKLDGSDLPTVESLQDQLCPVKISTMGTHSFEIRSESPYVVQGYVYQCTGCMIYAQSQRLFMHK